MTNRIPTVKEYIVTLSTGNRYRVTAPTRYLARLNFVFDRPADSFGHIVRVAYATRQVGQRSMIERAA